MLDIALIREKPEYVREAIRKTGDDPSQVDAILALDVRRRELLTEVEELRAERNRVSKEIGKLKKVHEFGDPHVDTWTTLELDLEAWAKKRKTGR